MKRLICIWIVVIMTFSLLLGACAKPAPPPTPAPAPAPTPTPALTETFTLKWAMWSPNTGTLERSLQWAADEITKRTNGAVKFEIYWAGSLMKATEMLDGCGAGTADMVYLQTGYFPTQLSLWDFGSAFPFVTNQTSILSRAQKDVYDTIPALEQELNACNQRSIIVSFYDSGFYQCWSTKPLAKLSDFKGTKIRVPSGAGDLITAVGGVPLFTPSADTYEALDKGIVDAAFMTVDAAVKYHFGEVVSYVTELPSPIAGVWPVMTMNLDTWNKLPVTYKKIILAVGQEQPSYFGQMLYEDRPANWKILKQETGGKLQRFTLTDAEIQLWRNTPEVKALALKWIEKRAGKPAKEIADKYLEFIEKERVKGPDSWDVYRYE